MTIVTTKKSVIQQPSEFRLAYLIAREMERYLVRSRSHRETMRCAAEVTNHTCHTCRLERMQVEKGAVPIQSGRDHFASYRLDLEGYHTTSSLRTFPSALLSPIRLSGDVLRDK